MSPRYDPTDDDAWDENDPDAPQARDLTNEDTDETPTVPCPSCRRPIPDFADRCPYCGDWVVQSAGAPARRKPWLIIVVIAVIITFAAWYVF